MHQLKDDAIGTDWANERVTLEKANAKTQLETLEDLLYSPSAQDTLSHQLLQLSHPGNIMMNLLYQPALDTK